MPYRSRGRWVQVYRRGRWVNYYLQKTVEKAKKMASALNIKAHRR